MTTVVFAHLCKPSACWSKLHGMTTFTNMLLAHWYELQGTLSAAQSRMESDAHSLQSLTAQRTELQGRAAQLEGALLRLEEAATERAQARMHQFVCEFMG